ncbi:adenylate kinase isoenzyme 6-like [Tigriopus californicus]|uniref:adenylate kinase isoenzyme 6-like n=1 Tax=Tigriopus californicus TaxID=6832 RepID=UPI0027DA1984|nr:adenylate kinase isoenzyme 6-like [Tigriopus californicus]|eukprot:TCALIF_01323-PA protein Name:"Similar to AK6 Adenylate kinase isoenzyme 6 (Homo sapiens)" AED:0.41 eAED:0.41 QI:0/-1/0/1/-1/1/1/0/188
MSTPAKKVRKSQAQVKSLPNILITGTPGTGKSTLSKVLGEKSGLKWISIGDFAKEKGFLGDYDSELECHELEEDPLLDELEDLIGAGGIIVDHHVTDFFPERYFDIVFVLRTDNGHLHDRLKARDYNEKKLQNNLECEIFQTILDEAKNSYDENIVHELTSNQKSDIESNLERILAWIDQWKSDNSMK